MEIDRDSGCTIDIICRGNKKRKIWQMILNFDKSQASVFNIPSILEFYPNNPVRLYMTMNNFV